MTPTGKAHILIDALGIDQAGGVRTHSLCLFTELFQQHPEWDFTLLLSQPETDFAPYPHVHQLILPWRKGPAARLAVQLLLPILQAMQRFDLVHYAKSQGAWLPGTIQILTLHDTTTLNLPEYHSRFAVWYWRKVMPGMARSMQAITTVSQHAAREIQERLHVPPEKIHVIYNAGQFQAPSPVSGAEFQALQAQYDLPERYLLFIGALALKKNLSTLVQAIEMFSRQRPGSPPLLMVGPAYRLSEDREVLNLVQQRNLERQVRYLGEIPKDHLHAILTHAELLVLPAIHEGFGIPVIEAMACGVPVIASRSSALPEIIEEAGLLVDEYEAPAAWATAITYILDHPELRQTLQETGFQRAADFSWERSAQQLAALYQDLLEATRKQT